MNKTTKAYITLATLSCMVCGVLSTYSTEIPMLSSETNLHIEYGIEKFNKLKDEAIEEQRIKEIERVRLEEEMKRLEEQKKNEPYEILQRVSRGGEFTEDYSHVEEIIFDVSFYSDIEGYIGGGSYGYKGDYLQDGDIALPKDVPYLSTVIFEGDNQVYTKRDVGGAIRRKDGVVCVDVFKKGYTTDQLNELGRYRVKGYIYHKK